MDILYRAGRATSAEVRAAMPDPPSYSAVRALLRILEEKGHVRHEQDAARYVFIPTPILVEIVAKTSVVLLLAGGVTWAMARRGWAAARHFVWAVALAATMALPGVVLFGPAWHVAGLPGTWMSPVDAVSNTSAGGA